MSNEKLLVPPALNNSAKSKQKSQSSDGGNGSDFLMDNSATTSDADPELEESSAETSIGSSGIRSSTPSDYGNYFFILFEYYFQIIQNALLDQIKILVLVFLYI